MLATIVLGGAPAEVPGQEPVVVVSTDPAWGPAVADLVSAGRRAALLVVEPSGEEALDTARELARELFGATSVEVLDTR